MANPPPPPAPGQKKKSGLGCLGCGCLVLVILVLLFVGMVGTFSYFGYHTLYSFTSPVASDVPTFDGGDDVYTGADQKVTAFNQDFQQESKSASLQLSGDEINTILARTPALSSYKIHLFVTLTGDQARAQMSLPLDMVPGGWFKGRYFNADTTLSFNLDADTHMMHLTFHSVTINGKPLPEQNLPLLQQELEPLLNAQLQKDPYLSKVLSRAKTIEIRDGQFIVETQ